MGHDQAPRGSGRGGRGHSRFHRSKGKSNQSSSSKQAATPTKKEPLMKFGVNTATTNCAPHAAVHEKTATCIQKNHDCGHDIAKSICTGQLVDLGAEKPTRAIATGTKAEKAVLQPGMDVEFSTRMSAHVKREQHLHSNPPKAFACVMNDCCTDGPKSRLIALPDCESAVTDAPLALLAAIETCVHENAHTQCPPVTVLTLTLGPPAQTQAS